VGETLLLTSTLANEGCSMVGLPQYTLFMMSDQSSPVLVPDPPEPIVHYLGLAPGQTDSAEFALQVVGSGQVKLGSRSSFEVHLGYPGPAYWAGDASEPVTVTVPLTDTEVSVLHQAAYELGCVPGIGCSPDVVINGATYRSDWVFAAGHSAASQLRRFADAPQALAAFEEARGDLVLHSFHCYLAYEWSYEQEISPERRQGQVWLADRWIVTSRSFDDTSIPVAPSPVAVSEAIYHAARLSSLFQACKAAYLPLVLGYTP
jgi:hypothetical protein